MIQVFSKKYPDLANFSIVDGDTSGLPMLWNKKHVIIFDCVLDESNPGKIIELNSMEELNTIRKRLISSHGFGLAESLELSREIDMEPASLTFYGITGNRFETGTKMNEKIRIQMHILANRVANSLLSFKNSEVLT